MAKVYGVVHIPPDLARDVKHGRGASITLLHNAQLATASSLLQRDLRQVVGTLSAGIEMQAAARLAQPGPARAWSRVKTSWWRCSTSPPTTSNSWPPRWCPPDPYPGHDGGRVERSRAARPHRGAVAERAWPRPVWQVAAALLGKLACRPPLLWAVTLVCLLYLAQLRGWAVAGSMGWIGAGLAALVAV